MAGSPEDYERVFRAEYGRLVRALTVAGGNADAAADAVQDAFVQRHRHWGRVARYEDPAAWLRRVALHRLSNQARGRRRRDHAVTRLAPPETMPATEPLDEDLRAAVARLAPGQRTAVALHYLADLPIADVARAMGVSEGTVKSQLSDARAQLRRTMEVIDDA